MGKDKEKKIITILVYFFLESGREYYEESFI
jgi:hypothetical protein